MTIPAPPWIEITTALPCKVGCYYCPQGVLRKAYQGDAVLTLARFKSVLANIPKDVLIDFAGFAEPFGNHDCAAMIVHAHQQGYRLAVNSTLIGMSEDDASRIAAVPFEAFYYHDVRLERREYQFVTDRGRIEQPDSRAGNLYAEDRREYDGHCARDLDRRIGVMLPNADVVLCCQDYGLKHKLGNLLEQRYEDLDRADDHELCHYCRHYEQD